MGKGQKYFYVVISATGTKIGKLIRIATHSEYNHAAIAFDGNMEQLWSFARYHYCLPLIGGLVRESRFRYTVGKGADIKVFKIPVSDENYVKGLARVKEINEDSDYAYNLISAATFWLRHGVIKYKTFTCSEFVSHLLGIMRPDIDLGKPCHKVTPKDFSVKLSGYEVYCGDVSRYDGFSDVCDESARNDFFTRYGKFEKIKKTVKHIIKRYARFGGGEAGIHKL